MTGFGQLLALLLAGAVTILTWAGERSKSSTCSSEGPSGDGAGEIEMNSSSRGGLRGRRR